ncbi:hypothetical protein Q75_06295 [Bacillus coahuilensis p1.1.43]|uniref:Swarming motility protein SwrB n=1 Tax=Bacillus coahuilensis p1.1.43 TaxID=1150625 RepID=A0A147K9R1_9BACI|nr:hypothetical protein [Bacillus coahuilensis]KUP07134.1 hypothetical protein Q75_06295 [Bacillus coahuilensis p1.1.43]
MITAIIFGSILLVLSYFFIILLYLRQNRLIEMEQKQQKVLKEMEDVISSYLEEMKSENERLILKLKSDHTMNQQQAPYMDTNSEANHTVALEKSHLAPEIAPVSSVPLSKAKKAYQQTADEQTNVESDPLKKDHIEDPFIRQVLFLHAKGLPPERIAQVLNKGTTEIELLLKFRQKQN